MRSRRRKLRHGTQEEDECVFKCIIMLFRIFVLENSESPLNCCSFKVFTCNNLISGNMLSMIYCLTCLHFESGAIHEALKG